MIFDKLCSIIEKYLPEYRQLVEESKLFVFDGKPHEFLPKKIDENALYNDFFLPFRTVAIEDSASVVILHDPFPNMVGFKDDRIFIECFSGEVEASNFGDSTKKEIDGKFLGDVNVCAIITGLIKLGSDSKHSKTIEGVIHRLFYVNMKTKKIVGDYTGKVLKELDGGIGDTSAQCLRNPATALEEILLLNTPKHFIVEDKPKKQHRSNKKIARSHQRSKFTLIDAKAIKKIFTEKTGKNFDKEITGHERRKHFRTLKSDKFVNKKGSTIVIPSTWVGPREVTTNKRIYKVRTDL